MYQRILYRSLLSKGTKSILCRTTRNTVGVIQFARNFSLTSIRSNISEVSNIPELQTTTTKNKPVVVKDNESLFHKHFKRNVNSYASSVGIEMLEGTIPEPYGILNNQTDEEKKKLVEKFRKTLVQIANDLEIQKNFLNTKITINDFVNPTYSKLMRLVYLIENETVPKNLLDIFGIKTNNELITRILSHLLHQDFLKEKIAKVSYQSSTIDISVPAEWFPEARKMKRKIVMHVGPTNSGKTYNSLVKLSKSKTGYYAGPLRLLAREVYERFNDQGVGCNLITGEEIVPFIDEHGKISGLASGTIEMIPLHRKMDLCVIDEIQMIADSRRGSVWTNAVLGVLAHEIHLCGEESAVPLIQKIVEITGDELEVKHFKRLGKLTVEKTSTRLLQLKKGDCLVAFSKRKIMDYKCRIEQESRLKVGVVYGALPPEIRSQEAAKFNRGEYDVLVASDAVGMGLNLKINRVVFSGISKYDGSVVKNLTVLQVKQIAGRAGRYSKDTGSKEGFVTALQRSSLVYIQECLREPVSYLQQACIWPTNNIWRNYMVNGRTDKVQLSDVLRSYFLTMLTTRHGLYFVSEWDQKVELLDLISLDKHLSRMSIDDQLTLCETPIGLAKAKGSQVMLQAVHDFFKTIVDRDCKSIFDYKFLDLELISQRAVINSDLNVTLKNVDNLENMHKMLLLFMWLSQRFPTLFIDKESALEMKVLVEKRITEELTNIERLNKLGGRSSNSYHRHRNNRC